MYHIVKPLGEWRYHDCEPAPGAQPRHMTRDEQYAGREPTFDIHDVRPTSRRGDEFLHQLHDEMRRQEERDRIVQPRFNDWEIPRSKKKVKTMSANVSMAEALLDNYHTIAVTIDHGMYIYKVPKDLELEVGDMVIVPRKKNFAAVRVTEVHGRNKNPDEIKLRWIVAKVDYTEYDARVAQDEKAVETIIELEKRKTKRALVNELTADLSAEETLQLSTDLGVDVCESPE